MKKILHYLLAFMIPVSIFLFAMYLMDLYPFGDTSMRVIDAVSQYPAFFEGLKDGDLFTFKIGMGANFYTIWTTYLASPLSVLYFFFENYQFDLFFVILVLLKIGLIGLNMNILLNYNKERNFYSLIFSTIYALSGYVSLYYFNYQFLDALYLLPLIMIGIDKLVNDNKNLMYFITLTLMIIFHYYTAYMICIFSVIYFFFLLINSEINRKDKRRKIIKFFITSLFCGLCSSFITIPSIYSLLQGRSSWYDNINYLSFNKNVLSMFYDFTSGSTYGNDIMYGAAPLFMTLFVIVLIICCFFDKNKSRKYKISIGIIFIVFVLSLSSNLFYYAWHVFQNPTYYPGRFVFCFVCFFVLISYQFFLNFNINFNLKRKILVILLFCVLIVISFIFKINFSEGFIFDKRFIILLIFNLLIYIYYIFCINNKKLISLTIFLIFLEIIINLICSFNSLLAHSNYYNVNVREYKQYIKNISNEMESINKSDFFRMNFNDKYVMNSGFVYNYNGISYFNSLYNDNILKFADNALMHGKNNLHITTYNGDFLLDSFLNIKYKLNLNDNNLEYIENKYGIESIGIMVPNNLDLKNSNISDSYNYFVSNSNYKINKYYINPEIMLENLESKDNKWVIVDNSKDGKVILKYKVLYKSLGYVETNKHDGVINSEKNIFDNYSEMLKLYLNGKLVQEKLYLEKGDIVTLEINVNKKIGFVQNDIWKMFVVNEEDYKNYINHLKENIITNINLNAYGFTGNLHVNKEKTLLLLTIPFDEGIEIYANGVKQKVEKYLNGIVGLNLLEGDYKIVFFYRVKGLKLGIIISSISLIMFVLLKVLEKLKINRYNKSDNKEECIK